MTPLVGARLPVVKTLQGEADALAAARGRERANAASRDAAPQLTVIVLSGRMRDDGR